MKPLIPIAVAIGLSHCVSLAFAVGPEHPLQPSAQRSVTVVESQAPPVVRAGLLQSTLIVLPAEEKVGDQVLGAVIMWVFGSLAFLLPATLITLRLIKGEQKTLLHS